MMTWRLPPSLKSHHPECKCCNSRAVRRLALANLASFLAAINTHHTSKLPAQLLLFHHTTNGNKGRFEVGHPEQHLYYYHPPQERMKEQGGVWDGDGV